MPASLASRVREQQEEQAGSSARHHPWPPPWRRLTSQFYKVALLTRGKFNQVRDRFAHSLRRPNTTNEPKKVLTAKGCPRLGSDKVTDGCTRQAGQSDCPIDPCHLLKDFTAGSVFKVSLPGEAEKVYQDTTSSQLVRRGMGTSATVHKGAPASHPSGGAPTSRGASNLFIGKDCMVQIFRK